MTTFFPVLKKWYVMYLLFVMLDFLEVETDDMMQDDMP